MTAIGPAHSFLHTTPITQWSIVNYLSTHRAAIILDFDHLCADWVRELTRINDLPPAESSTHRRNAARNLLKRYKSKGQDYIAARAIKDLVCLGAATTGSTATSANQPSITIHGSSLNDATFAVNSTVQTEAPSQKRKRGDDKLLNKGKQPESEKRAKKGKGRSKRPAAAPGCLKSFARSYKAMSSDCKWKLPSGLYVEDILWERFKGAPQESTAHSWVLDVRDEVTKALFTPEDWESILGEIPPLPDSEPAFVAAMMRYATFASNDNLRMHLDTHPAYTPTEASTLSATARASHAWLHQVLTAWTKLCASPSMFMLNHREFWYIANFWHSLFDSWMSSIPGAYMSRGESKSLSTSSRKNSAPNGNNNDATRRRRIGHLYDGVLRIHDVEVGVAEHARTWIDVGERKWVTDTLKVVKVLHDMLYEIQSPRMQVVGFVTAAWRCQLLRMCYAKGYVCALSADAVRKVPSFDEGVLGLLELVGVVWKMREVLKVCDELLHPGKNMTPQQLAERLLKGEQGKKAILIPRSAETEDDTTREDSAEDDVDEGGDASE